MRPTRLVLGSPDPGRMFHRVQSATECNRRPDTLFKNVDYFYLHCVLKTQKCKCVSETQNAMAKDVCLNVYGCSGSAQIAFMQLKQ